MGNRKEITDTLSAAIEKKINPYNDSRIYWAKEVTFDYSTNHAVRVDYMKFVPVNNSVSGIVNMPSHPRDFSRELDGYRFLNV